MYYSWRGVKLDDKLPESVMSFKPLIGTIRYAISLINEAYKLLDIDFEMCIVRDEEYGEGYNLIVRGPQQWIERNHLGKVWSDKAHVFWYLRTHFVYHLFLEMPTVNADPETLKRLRTIRYTLDMLTSLVDMPVETLAKNKRHLRVVGDSVKLVK